MKLNSQQLRAVEPSHVADIARTLKRNPLAFILENIYDTYNVGGLFRLADGLAVQKMYLCGGTTTPPNNRIHKASCGTYKIVPWEYCSTTVEAINKFRSESRTWNIPALRFGGPALPIGGPVPPAEARKTWNSSVIAIEQSSTSIPYSTLAFEGPTALLVGNESTGVTLDTLSLCDKIAEIPMWGINKSLNVIVSAAIVSFHIIHH